MRSCFVNILLCLTHGNQNKPSLREHGGISSGQQENSHINHSVPTCLQERGGGVEVGIRQRYLCRPNSEQFLISMNVIKPKHFALYESLFRDKDFMKGRFQNSGKRLFHRWHAFVKLKWTMFPRLVKFIFLIDTMNLQMLQQYILM